MPIDWRYAYCVCYGFNEYWQKKMTDHKTQKHPTSL